MKLQRLVGYAAIGTICAYLAAVGVVLSKIGFDISDPAKAMTALLAAPAFSYVLLLLLIASYLLLFIMAFALQEHMQANAPHLTRLMMIAASVAVAMQIAGAKLIGRLSAFFAFCCSAPAASDRPASDKMHSVCYS